MMLPNGMSIHLIRQGQTVWRTRYLLQSSAMEGIPQVFLSLPLYIPLPHHPITREKVSVQCYMLGLAALTSSYRWEAIRARARQPRVHRVDSGPPEDAVDDSSCTRPLYGGRGHYPLYPRDHSRRNCVFSPEPYGKPCVYICQPCGRKAYTRTSEEVR